MKIPKRSSEDTKEVIRRYQRGHQKIPKRSSEDTKEVIRSCDSRRDRQNNGQRIPKRSSETDSRRDRIKSTIEQTMIDKPQH